MLGDVQFGVRVGNGSGCNFGVQDGREVIGDVDANLGQGRIVVGAERVERLGATLGGAVGAEQPVLEVERYLGYCGTSADLGAGDFDRRDEVFAAVGAQHADGNLAPCEDHGFGEVLEQETQRRGRIGHGVGAVQHDEAVVTGIVVADELRQGDPVVRGHIGRIDHRRHGSHVDVDVEPLERGKLVVDSAEVERHQGAGFGIGLHADRAAGVDDEDRGFRGVHFGIHRWFVVCSD